MFIVCVMQVEGMLEYAGTAFAVGETRVVTCSHNIMSEVEGNNGTTVFTDCVLVSVVYRYASGFEYPEERIPIRLSTYNEEDDWAVFERTDGKTFSTYLEIEEKFPEPSSVLQLTIYHAPLSVTEPGGLNTLSIWSETTTLLQYDCKVVEDRGSRTRIDNRYAVLTNGKCGGSSGSPVVTSDGKVLAFHTASFNESVAEDIAPESKLTASNLKMASGDQVECGSNSSRTSRSYANYSHATIISTIPGLMSAIIAPAGALDASAGAVTKDASAGAGTKDASASAGEKDNI